MDAPIGVTANHPIWSEDRKDFISAGDLLPGEKLLTANYTVTNVMAVKPHNVGEPVYNLEVDGEHVYFVSAAGILVHNSKSYLVRNDTQLLRNLGGFVADHTPHHVIPVSVANTRGMRGLFEKASLAGWELNGRRNGMMLNNLIEHVNHHPRYNAYMEQQVRSYIKRNGGIKNISGEQAKNYLDGLADRTRKYLRENPGKDINKLFE